MKTDIDETIYQIMESSEDDNPNIALHMFDKLAGVVSHAIFRTADPDNMENAYHYFDTKLKKKLSPKIKSSWLDL